MPDSIFCNECGSENQLGSKFCSNCGKTLVASVKSQPQNKVVEETESTCPKCKRDDRVEGVGTIFLEQSSMVGYGENRDVRQTSLAESLMHALGSKPRPEFIDKLLFGAAAAREVEEYEKAGERWRDSYYCSRCGEVFFTVNGKKQHSNLGGFEDLLREDFDD